MFSKYNLFLFDMDGTLYLGDQLYDFTKEKPHIVLKDAGEMIATI